MKNDFNTITDLAKYLGVSRKTLYKRAEEHNINLSGSYSTDDLSLLGSKTAHQSNKKSVTTVTSDINKGNTSSKHQTHQNTPLNSELRSQINDLKNDKIFLQKEIESKNKTISETTKLLDQAQQLQLDLQNKLNHSEQERLSLLSTSQQLTDTNARVDEQEKTIAELESQITNAQQQKEDLQEQLSSKSNYASYLYEENRDLEKDKTLLLQQQSEADVAQQTIEQLQTELEETQTLVQEKDHQRQLLADRSTSLSDKLTDTRKQLKDEQNKGFWKRVFGR
ncbi:hypothetical protein [Weissella minor]|uniref:hypothetical protein n=1 Tax=Weissella minor TaxID=1620 RepID=UPI003AF26C78